MLKYTDRPHLTLNCHRVFSEPSVRGEVPPLILHICMEVSQERVNGIMFFNYGPKIGEQATEADERDSQQS